MIRFFIRNRVLTNLATLFFLVLGGASFLNVRREGFPEISFDWLSVTTLYPGASPAEVETLVTNVIEKELRAVDGLDRVQSWSLEGRSMVLVRLEEDLSKSEKSRVINSVEQAVNRATDLPEEAEEPEMKELTFDHPLITLSVAGGTEEARDELAEQIADTIEDIPGVSRVDQAGDLDKEIWIEADQNKLAAARLTLAELAQAVRGHNLDASAGFVDVGREEVFVRVLGAAKGADDIGRMIVRGNDERSFLRVRDVATVLERYESPRSLTRANGKPSINLLVKKVKSGDTIRLAEAVRQTQSLFEGRARKMGIELVASDDLSFLIKRRLHVMTNNMIQGGALILVALFLFLDWRLALVAALGVPISLASAMAVAVPFGFTISLISLLAFIIVLGILDDDSVVVAENIYRHLEMGKPPLEAAVEGTREVIKPVLGAVAVSCCGFLPFAMVSGIMGKVLFIIPIVIVICFATSVLEAFFILPAHVLEIMPLGKPVEENADRHWYKVVLSVYRRSMSWVLGHRIRFLLLVTGVLITAAFGARWSLKVVLFPEGLVEQFFVNLELPEGASLESSRMKLEEMEALVARLPTEEQEAFTSLVGVRILEDNSFMYGTHLAQIRVFLTPEGKRHRKARAIIEDLRRQSTALAGIRKVTFEELHAGPPVGRAVDVRVRGKDTAVVGAIVEEVKKRLAAMPGVSDIRDSREGGKKELRIRLNDREAGFAQLDASRVAANIFYAIDGGQVSKIRRPTEEVKIKVRLKETQRQTPEELLNLGVVNAQGRPISLGRVARLETGRSVAFIEHYNFKPAIQVTAEVDKIKATSSQATRQILEEFKDLPHKHPGTELVFGGEAEETEKSMRSLARAFAVALGLDFIILAALFSSYIQPFIIILLTVPIGLVGVVAALILHRQPASFMALLGVVAMTGVVINNAIVLVNFINERRKAGASLKEAAIEAGAMRLRPIWASSITTLLGLFPTAYGWGGNEPFVAPMALAMAWGLTLAMPMTLFLIPTAYVILDDVTTAVSRQAAPLKAKLTAMIQRLTR